VLFIKKVVANWHCGLQVCDDPPLLLIICSNALEIYVGGGLISLVMTQFQ